MFLHTRGALRRVGPAAIAALAATAAVASSASASQVFTTNDTGYLTVLGSPGERNFVTIQDESPGIFRVFDTGATLSPGANCVSLDAHSARCVPRIQTRRAAVYLGDQDDGVFVKSAFLNGGIILSGDAGNDIFSESASAVREDIYGGTGVDRVSYETRSTDVQVALNDQPDDGQAGEGDNVHSDVENAFGGEGNDRLYGSSAANELHGNGGNDDVDGFGGADQMYGEAGNDRLFGNGDAIKDIAICGDGYDQAFLDLPDGRGITCEYFTRTPKQTGHSAQFVDRTARVRGGSVAVRLRCLADRQGGVCAGTLRLARGGRTLGSARYSLRRKRSTTVRVPLRSAIRGRMKVTATANEKARDGREMTTTAPITLIG